MVESWTGTDEKRETDFPVGEPRTQVDTPDGLDGGDTTTRGEGSGTEGGVDPVSR